MTFVISASCVKRVRTRSVCCLDAMLVVVSLLFPRSPLGSMYMIVMEPEGAHQGREEQEWEEE